MNLPPVYDADHITERPKSLTTECYLGKITLIFCFRQVGSVHKMLTGNLYSFMQRLFRAKLTVLLSRSVLP